MMIRSGVEIAVLHLSEAVFQKVELLKSVQTICKQLGRFYEKRCCWMKSYFYLHR